MSDETLDSFGTPVHHGNTLVVGFRRGTTIELRRGKVQTFEWRYHRNGSELWIIVEWEASSHYGLPDAKATGIKASRKNFVVMPSA